jgi:hypothetical protein
MEIYWIIRIIEESVKISIIIILYKQNIKSSLSM